MHDFEYEAPTTLAELRDLMVEHQDRARFLAGGTDLIDHIRTGRFTPDVVIDVKKIDELNQLSLDGSSLTIGAAVPCYRIYEHTEIRQNFAALVDAVSIIGGIQIQNRATLGGNLCTSSPAADSIPALIALRGVCVIEGPNGRREIPVEEFCTGPGRNVLSDNSDHEVLVALRVPRPDSGTATHYRRFIPRNEMDIAVVGVATSLQLSNDAKTIEDIRVALGAVAPMPILVEEISTQLAGQPIDAAIPVAMELARSAASPIDDIRGTTEFRTHVVGVLVERAIRETVARISG